MTREELYTEIYRLSNLCSQTDRKESRKIMLGLIDRMLEKYKQLIEKEMENGKS